MPKVPKRAVFYWEGPPMSWLRARAIQSFKELNPDWSVHIIGPHPAVPITGKTRRAIVQRSDWSRWIELSANGGVYFDTDIMFVRPVPESVLDCNVGLSIDREGAVSSIGMIAASPNNPFFGRLVEMCERRHNMGRIAGFQEYGIRLLWCLGNSMSDGKKPYMRVAAANAGFSFKAIPLSFVQPITWDICEQLWWDVPLYTDADTIGLHWYGGDALSQELEPQINEDWIKHNDCPVSRATMRRLD